MSQVNDYSAHKKDSVWVNFCLNFSYKNFSLLLDLLDSPNLLFKLGVSIYKQQRWSVFWFRLVCVCVFLPFLSFAKLQGGFLCNFFKCSRCLWLKTRERQKERERERDLFQVPYTQLYCFPRAAITKYHKQGGLRQHKSIPSQFLRIEAYNQHVSRAMLPLKHVGKNLSLPLSLQRWLSTFGIPWFAVTSPYSLPLSSHGIRPACLCLHMVSSSS